MDIEKLNDSITKMVNSSNKGILSVAIYSYKDDLVITGSNIDYQVASTSNDLFKNFLSSLKMFNFSDTLKNIALTFDDKVFYIGKLNLEFNFTIVVDPSKIELGFFKGILLKDFISESY